MPDWKNKLVKVDDLANFVAEASLGLFLRKEIDWAVFDHHSVNAVLVDCLVNEF
jgi:hypothetical protein